MWTESKEFFSKMMDFLPCTVLGYNKSIEKYGKVLETVVIEDIFMPELIKLLAADKEINILNNIFDYFETISNSRDEHLINIFSVTVLEILGNDKRILEVAKKYMGPVTVQLQIEADRDLGRVWHNFLSGTL